MTRINLLSTMLAVPLAALGAARASVGNAQQKENVVFLSPGTYTIAEGGGIKIVDASNIHIEGCTFRSTS